MLTLDFVSKRYGRLPSEIMLTGSTFDFHIADLAIKYETYCREAAEAKATGRAPPAPKLSVTEMQAMMDNVRKPKTHDKHES